MNGFSQKVQKPNFRVIFDHFWSFLKERNFFKKNQALPRTSPYDPLTQYKVLEKTNEPIPRKLPERRTNGQTDGQKDRRKDRHGSTGFKGGKKC